MLPQPQAIQRVRQGTLGNSGLHFQQVDGRFWIYVQHVNLRAARRFTCCPKIYGHLVPIHAPRCSFITQVSRQKGKSHHMIQNNLSILFFLYLITIFIDFRVW